MEGHLIVSDKELRRKGAFEMVSHGAWSLVDAASHLKLSFRQCCRSFRRYLAEGDAGLVHRSRGRPSNRAKDAALRQALEGPEYAAWRLGRTIAASPRRRELSLHPIV